MNAAQQNMLVILLLVGAVGLMALTIALLSSRSVRDEGLRRFMKRLLSR